MKKICIVSFFTLVSFSMEHDPFKQKDIEEITYKDLGLPDPLKKTSASPCQKESDTVLYQCTQCTYNTIYKDNIVRHVREHTLTDKYSFVLSCPLCHYLTHTINDLKVHYFWHINAEFMDHKQKLLKAIRRLQNADELRALQDQLEAKYKQRLQSSNPEEPNHEALVNLLKALSKQQETSERDSEPPQSENNTTLQEAHQELLQTLKQLHNVIDSND